ncbi:ribonuclease P protein component [Stenomitos frigidus]|uniref:Ribonuclease P protein component n=1 Tax=Stenomitos frigidus ULC18 TaxID=2107698 RepID=A0A2T1E030_9CYAN|nr:ribonuclease P protein component [Stenomitos frigidus]PSB25974.1 ribonuclease P protein component [Stenomitos frigidus ULC18]
MALSKANRLRSRQDFNAVYRKGRRRKSNFLTIIVLRKAAIGDAKQSNDGTEALAAVKVVPHTRVGISISQKVSKRAVVRNRIKRWLKVAVRSLLPGFPTGWDIVVIVHPEATQCDYRQFLQELEQLLVNAEVCDGH